MIHKLRVLSQIEDRARRHQTRHTKGDGQTGALKQIDVTKSFYYFMKTAGALSFSLCKQKQGVSSFQNLVI